MACPPITNIQLIGELMFSVKSVTKPRFHDLLADLSTKSERPVTCVIADGFMSFVVDIAKELGVREMTFWAFSPCCLWTFLNLPKLIEEGQLPVGGEDFYKIAADYNMDRMIRGVPDPVVYVSFGSTGLMTRGQLLEFWHGLVNSGKPFLWVVRRDGIEGAEGEHPIPEELQESTKERGFLVDWAPQEEVLAHQAVGGFLTHNGWNSTLEGIVAGVPMVCWPTIADQQINNRWVSEEMKSARLKEEEMKGNGILFMLLCIDWIKKVLYHKLGDDSTLRQRAFMLALSGKKAIGTTIEKATRRNKLFPLTAASNSYKAQ
ncbi:hypothetical protein FH972_017285 [Carpinus fangiana]|uniref:UDP-glycosyltransferases domain-containing protein n=1 Tax=Carpinus fangiana TaxID=176857 RepID=A0A5N6RIH3_9ROSI|nr:hypothetical protein FH972_017285 [Carpinus fangiana]